MLLPATGTPMTGIDFTKRLPCGETEKARKVHTLIHCVHVHVHVYRISGKVYDLYFAKCKIRKIKNSQIFCYSKIIPRVFKNCWSPP